MTAWFSQQEAGLIGGLLGGILGGVGVGGTGALIGICAPRGKLKRFVITLQSMWVVLGVAFIGVGLYANFTGQPSHVPFVFLLPGFIMAAIMGAMLPVTLMRYRQAEQRKLEAEELRRG
jgi:hypothetical protein